MTGDEVGMMDMERLTVGVKSMSYLLSRIILIVLLCWIYCKDWHFHVDD